MWQFIHLTDIHIGEKQESQGTSPGLSDYIPEILRNFSRDLAKLKPDFILVTGDLVSEKSRDSVFAARDLLDSLETPYYPVGGDNDFAFEKGREWFLDAFYNRLPIRDTAYSFSHKGLHIVVLDPWWCWPDGTISPSLDGITGKYSWRVPPHQLIWLEEDLECHQHMPTLIAVHCPIFPSQKRLDPATILKLTQFDQEDLLYEVLHRHKQVKAIFSGHVHAHYIESATGICQVVTSGFSRIPIKYRIASVYDDRIEISTRSLHVESLLKDSPVLRDDATLFGDYDRRVVIRLP